MFRIRFKLAILAVLSSLLGFAPSLAADDASEKLAIPDAADQQEVLKLVGEVFGKEYKQAKTPAQKLAIARKLLKAGVEAKNDAAERFILFQVARKMAVKAGDTKTALAAVNEAARSFRIDALAMKVDVVAALGKSAVSPAQRRSLAEAFPSLIDEALDNDQYDAATALATTGALAARKARNLTLAKRLDARRKQIETLRQRYAAVRDALAVLGKMPDDARANLTAGRHRCFVKGDWKAGLPMLARGSDAKLKALAEQDLAEPTVAQQQASLGNGWWDLSEQYEGPTRDRLQARGGHWYRLAVANLKGLSKVRAQKRLDRLAAAGKAKPVANDRPRKGIAAIDARGADENGTGWRRHGVLPAHSSGIRCVVFAPNGRTLASSDGNNVRISDPVSGRVRGMLTGHTRRINHISFSADGALVATASDDRTARVWDTKTGRVVSTFSGHTKPVAAAALSPDGKLLVTAGETIRLSDPVKGQQTFNYELPAGGGGTWASQLSMAPDGKLLAAAVRTGGGGTSVKLYAIGKRESLKAAQGFLSAFSPNGKVLATGGSGTGRSVVKLYDLATFKHVDLAGHTGRVQCIAFYPTGKMLASGGEDRNIILWSTVTMKRLVTLQGHNGTVRSLAFSPDGTMLASGGDDRAVVIWHFKPKR